MSRKAEVVRNTKETQIRVAVDLDGTGVSAVSTGIGFIDHMLDSFARHGGIDLTVETKGDLHIDSHHTIEDTALALGAAFREALGDKRGIVRFADASVPLDESLAQVTVDLSGRPYLVFNVPLQRTRIANFDLDLLKDFFRAVAVNAEITLHLNMHYGENLHHIAEATFKAAGRALAEATRLNPRITGILSTKGSL